MVVLQAIRAFLRVLTFIVVSLFTCLIMVIVLAVSRNQLALARILYMWRRCMIATLNLRVTQHGQLPDENCIVMSNHRSYTDILLHMVGVPVVFVAKASIRSWPIVGWAARMIGVIFVDRSSTKSRAKTRNDIRDRLRGGANILMYPEGTTHRGPELLEYRPGAFRVAAEEGFPIVACAIEYRNQNIAWVGEETFLPHFLRTFGGRRLEVTIAFSSLLQSGDAEVIRTQAVEWTSAQVLAFRNAYGA